MVRISTKLSAAAFPDCFDMRRTAVQIACAAALLATLLPGLATASRHETIAGRASVIDGDTLKIHGQRVRLFGVDAPEGRQLCRDAACR